MKNLVCTCHAKERLEIARRHSILHLERIVGNPEVIRLSYDSDAIGNTLLRRTARGLSTVYLGCDMVGASLWRLIARGGGFGHD